MQFTMSFGTRSHCNKQQLDTAWRHESLVRVLIMTCTLGYPPLRVSLEVQYHKRDKPLRWQISDDANVSHRESMLMETIACLTCWLNYY